ncbi:hypothetical protein EFN80_00150 [Lactococcus lactis]|uniref:hypothetical protein n=1 Tax=Lactococcus lactis TaxID=1358 RepID=UPI0021A6A57E|nr:hypothetical protein [Lactococcus lactis]MCT3086237.1 hypothetical protein [Lactococcus lactis]
MGLLDSVKITLQKKNKEIIISNVESLSKEEKDYMIENLVAISQGRGSFYSHKTIAKKIHNFMKKQDVKTYNGATAEFFLACILRKAGFSQECCYRNLEENSIKKGFDGLFLKDNQYWLTESKSSAAVNIHNNCHNHTVSLAFRGLKAQISGSTNNDPWENAVSHAKSAQSEDSLIKKLVKLSENYTEGEYETIGDQNIIIGSTIFSSPISNINYDEKTLGPLIENHEVSNEVLVAINLDNNEMFVDFISEVANGE